jgi:hypothetical protein
LKAEVRGLNGHPAVLADGEEVVPLVVEIGIGVDESQVRSAVQSGVRLFQVSDIPLGWRGPGQFDYHEVDERLASLQRMTPESSFLIEVKVDPPDWWLTTHRDDCAVYLDNVKAHRDSVVSWASQKWRTEAGAALSKLIAHIQHAPYGPRCIGWILSAGESGEWRCPDAEDLPDVSAVMTAHFRSWCAQKYRHNTGLLRKAWFDARAEFPSIQPPDARERRRTDFGVLRNPTRSRKILDYYESFSDAQNSAALHFCALARNAARGAAIVGLSYATVSDTSPHAEDGHGLPEPVLDSQDVHFFTNRGSSDSAYARGLTGSIALRGKFFFHRPPVDGDPLQAAAIAITHAAGVILPVATAPQTLKAIHDALERAQPLSAKVRRRASPIAVIVDMANRYYVAEPAAQSEPVNSLLLTAQIEELTRTGTPFDLYLLSDLFQPKFPDYKVVMFLNTFYLSQAERRRVDAQVKRSGTTAVWLWGAGLIGEDGVGAEYGHRLCGQKVRAEAGSTSLRVRIAEGNDPLTWGEHPGTQFGPDRSIGPIVTIADKAVTRLGANSDNKTVFAALRSENWTSVVYGTAPVPAHMLRNLLRGAGAHLFSDADGVSVDADSRSVAFSSKRGGKYKISLPGRFDVNDAWTNKTIARGVTELIADVKPGQTAFFELTKRGGPSAEGRARPEREARTKVSSK